MRTRASSIWNYIIGVICRTRRRCLATLSAGPCLQDSSSKATRNTLTRAVTIKQASKQLPTPPPQIRQSLPSSSSSSQEAQRTLLDNKENSSTYQTKKSTTSDIYEILTGQFQPPISPPTSTSSSTSPPQPHFGPP